MGREAVTVEGRKPCPFVGGDTMRRQKPRRGRSVVGI
jgi:hypothetical protein